MVTADNDGNAADPFTATFRTAPHGRTAFRFTLDLATPNTAWVLSYGQSAYAVDAVESFQPLFHLLNGDQCYADLNPTVQPEVWRDFGNNNQTSAANRPWMPCLGNHEVEFIAVFDVHPDPEDFGGHTSITVTQYHAVGADPVHPATGAKGAPTPDYTDFETFTLIRPRRG